MDFQSILNFHALVYTLCVVHVYIPCVSLYMYTMQSLSLAYIKNVLKHTVHFQTAAVTYYLYLNRTNDVLP